MPKTDVRPEECLSQHAGEVSVAGPDGPIRIVRDLVKLSDFDEGDPYAFVECVQTIFPIEGTATPVTPGTVIDFRIPDMYGRPWAEIWERYWEIDMEKPEESDVFNFE